MSNYASIAGSDPGRTPWDPRFTVPAPRRERAVGRAPPAKVYHPRGVEIATSNEHFLGDPYFYGNQGTGTQVPGVRGYPDERRDGPTLNTQWVPQVYAHPDDYYIYAPYAGAKGTGSAFPWTMEDPTPGDIYPAYVQEPRAWGPYPSLSFGMLPGVDTRGLHYNQPYYRRQVIPPTYAQTMDYQLPLQRSYQRDLGRARRLRQMA